ncbi:hypothetical protein BH09ACT1_BH09ACT1_18940 [soil metagenome]
MALYRGVYLDAAYWSGLNDSERYQARIRAVTRFRTERLVLSHFSAAALWRLPSIDQWPKRVHAIVHPSKAGRPTHSLVRHASARDPSPVSIDGLLVTGLARTVIDLTTTQPFAAAVVFADAALRLTDKPRAGVPRSTLTRSDLEREAQGIPLRRGAALARDVIAFADGRADRPGESLSRVNMRVAGIPAPHLQEPLRGASGKGYQVDFWWPKSNLIGEFDGQVKYTDAEFAAGRSPAQIVYDEKLREDDLRAAGYGMCRWPWSVAISPEALRTRLAQAGLAP